MHIKHNSTKWLGLTAFDISFSSYYIMEDLRPNIEHNVSRTTLDLHKISNHTVLQNDVGHHLNTEFPIWLSIFVTKIKQSTYLILQLMQMQ